MYQFFKIEGYAREGAHKKNSRYRKPSIGDIVAELVRAPHACSHVATPQPPLILYGCDPSEIPAMACELASGACNKLGYKLRCDSPVALFGVATWPVPCATLDIDPAEREKYLAWRGDVIELLKEMWGANLVCVAEHTDEPYAHVHFCAMPQLPPDRRLTIADVHPGHRAARDASKAGSNRKEQKRVYKAAMADLQDRYYLEVGAKYGLTRLGPRRQRLTRKEWSDQKRQAQALAAARTKYAEDLKAAAKRELAERLAFIEREAKLMVAAATAASEERVSRTKQKAAGYIASLGKLGQELHSALEAKDKIIAWQEDENAAMKAILAEHGISLTRAI
jgi:hypothetical protein